MIGSHTPRSRTLWTLREFVERNGQRTELSGRTATIGRYTIWECWGLVQVSADDTLLYSDSAAQSAPVSKMADWEIEELCKAIWEVAA
jgi:hypothetical protein